MLNLLVTDTWINLDVTIDSFAPDPFGAYGDVSYSIKFSQAKDLKIYTTNELKIAALYDSQWRYAVGDCFTETRKWCEVDEDLRCERFND